MNSAKQILKKYWSHESFRGEQEKIIRSVLDGKDTLALLPTGGGKSVCFQIPALMNDGMCLVISPLIALMKDQVENLKKNGIYALSIYAGMSFLEIKKTLQNAAYGNYKLLYISPERLETDLFIEYLSSMNINLIAVDEAHCISQWGYDFRPAYLHIAQLKEYLPNVPILALTASATAEVQQDICEKLLFSDTHHRYQDSFARPNLSYSVFNVGSKQNKLLEIVAKVKGSAIVYCKNRKHTKDVSDLLTLNGIRADYYHAGLSYAERNTKQENWIQNKTRIIVCTNAFGMGIDKPDVRVIVHYDVPDCLENYYQEAGRAGRDGKRAYAVLLYSKKELEALNLQTNIRYPSRDEIKKVYTDVMNHLQIPAGSGAGMSFDFDIIHFSKLFKYDVIQATYAIKTLEQEEIIRFNEIFFKPSTLVFTCQKNELSDFENEHPEYAEIIKGLLRSYEGIFDFPCSISENNLSKFIHKKPDEIFSELSRLNNFGIVDFSPQKDKPQISLLQNRMYADNFSINLENHLKRREKFEIRIHAIIHYINQSTDCRSKMIGIYFNDQKITDCGICDNCIQQKKAFFSSNEFNHIANHIFSLLHEKEYSTAELLNMNASISQVQFWKVIEYLLAEKKILTNKDGKITKSN